MTAPITFGSLFAGIGGFDLGLERAGMKCRWQVEINDFCRKVLRKHWPDVRRRKDVCKFPPEPFGEWKVDLISGGFPCQDIAPAGKRKGITGERSGLWVDFARIVRQLRPKYVIVENSSEIAIRGLDKVLADLAELGFDAEWSLVPSCSLGTPHSRKRMFVVAYPNAPRFGELWRVRFLQVLQKERDSCRWPGGPEPPRMAHGLPDRSHRCKAIGNSIIPQIATLIGKAIVEADKEVQKEE